MSPQDWERYEMTLVCNAERTGADEARVYAQSIRARRLLPEGRDTLGFALLLFSRS